MPIKAANRVEPSPL